MMSLLLRVAALFCAVFAMATGFGWIDNADYFGWLAACLMLWIASEVPE